MADLPAARYQIPNARRQDTVDQLGEPQGGQRGLFGRFDHNGVAGGERRRRFSCNEHKRVIEWDDASDHSEGLAHREIDRLRAHWDRRAFHLGDEAGIEVELCRPHLGITHHLGIGIAAISGVDHRKLIAVLAQHVGDRAQHLCPFERRHVPPVAKGGLGGSDGGLRISRGTVDHLAQRLAGSWADGLHITR